MALPFANDGSFFEQFQAVQQRQRGQAGQLSAHQGQPAAPDGFSHGAPGEGLAAEQAAPQLHSAPHSQAAGQPHGNHDQGWQQQQHYPPANDGSWGRDWVASPPGGRGAGHHEPQQRQQQQQQQEQLEQLEPGEYRPEPGEARPQQLWQQEQLYYAEAAEPHQHGGGAGASAPAWDERVARETYDPATGQSYQEQQQRQYEADAAAAQQSYEQQQQQAAYAELPQISDFNACATWNGPYPGFVFKFGTLPLAWMYLPRLTTFLAFHPRRARLPCCQNWSRTF